MTETSGGRGVTGLEGLLLVFIVLKLTHVIDWSWWWVLSPIWILLILLTIIWALVLVLKRRVRQARERLKATAGKGGK